MISLYRTAVADGPTSIHFFFRSLDFGRECRRFFLEVSHSRSSPSSALIPFLIMVVSIIFQSRFFPHWVIVNLGDQIETMTKFHHFQSFKHPYD